ncbi:PHP domain-containing protein [Maribellus sediminis]|uniref:PHP domain-containing protein n=1 Tax=Maribellus sediminis TaxID=2696285 RepID=UPI001430FD1C|nr:PHP domain-containing protein [Maribellus sediminis]
MLKFRADLHIHTVLSPCADLEMSPRNIVSGAKEAGLQIIGITDHNSTRNALVIKNLAQAEGIYVLMGAEVTTKEEVHCLAFFEGDEELKEFQNYLDDNITKIPNPNGHFGYQPVVDADENVLEMVDYFLTSALKKGISEIQQKVYDLNGIFIPAHVTRPMGGIFTQLGFIPATLSYDALGITSKTSAAAIRATKGVKPDVTLVYNSDAHFPEQIGRNYSVFHLEEVSFKEIRMALNRLHERFVEER